MKFREGHAHCYGELNLEETKACLLDIAQRNNIEAFTLLSIPHYPMPGPHYLENLRNLWIKDNLYPKVFSHMGLVHTPESHKDPTVFLEQLDRAITQGFDGAKLWEGEPMLRKQLGIPLNDPLYDLFYDRLEETGMPVVMHANDPPNYWDPSIFTPERVAAGYCYSSPGYCTYEEIYDEVYGLLEKHPTLHITFAHFFFLSEQLDRADALLKTYPNVMLDLTPGGEMYIAFTQNPDKARDFFLRNQDRLYLGTDLENNARYLRHQALYDLTLNFLMTSEPFEFQNRTYLPLGLPSDVVQKILYDNQVRRNGELPRKTNPAAIREEILRMESIQAYLSDAEKQELAQIREFYANR